MLLRGSWSCTGAATRSADDRVQPAVTPASNSIVARYENRESAGGMGKTACYDTSVVTACLDPGEDGRAVGQIRLAPLVASLLVLMAACAPRPVHRAVQLDDAGDEGGADG